jgi:DNA-binding NarL/FixJ family response regulator
VRILIVDDHPLVREGIVARLAAETDFVVCGEAANVNDAVQLARMTQPTVMIVDLALQRGESGLDVIKAITKADEVPRPKILVVSAYEGSRFAERALRAGAHGYINKQELQGSMIEAIHAVLRGEIYLNADLTQHFLLRTRSGGGPAVAEEGLTDRELQVFDLIGRGKSTRAIAEQLGLSVHTIETHREKIRVKLNLRNGTELMQRAVRWVLENGY